MQGCLLYTGPVFWDCRFVAPANDAKKFLARKSSRPENDYGRHKNNNSMSCCYIVVQWAISDGFFSLLRKIQGWQSEWVSVVSTFPQADTLTLAQARGYSACSANPPCTLHHYPQFRRLPVQAQNTKGLRAVLGQIDPRHLQNDMGRCSSFSHYRPSQRDVCMVTVTRKPCLGFSGIRGRIGCELDKSNYPLTLLLK